MQRTFACAGLAAAAWLLICSSARAGSREGEAERARRTAARIEAEWSLVGSGPVSNFISELGARLGRSAGSIPFPWTFVVFRDRNANAFAIGGGRVYVSDGSVSVCASEAEVAAILAHEMAHEIAGHFRVKGSKTAMGHKSKDTKRSPIGSVVQEFDPTKEIEADRMSIRIMEAAGYSPHAALDVALRSAKTSGRDDPEFHARRVEALRVLLRNAPRSGRSDSKQFVELKRQVTRDQP